MRFRNLILAAALAALPLARGALAAAAPGSWPPADGEIRRMLAERLQSAPPGTGIVVGVVDPGGRRIIAEGTLARGDLRRVGGDTVFWIASLTKVFTATLLCQMADQRELTIDEPVAELLPKPGDRLPRAGANVITLADLATMTSGLPPWPGNLRPLDRQNPFAGYSAASLLSFVAFAPPVPISRRRYVYSDVGYGLLGQALAHRGGTGWAALIQARIAGPLGLTDTAVDPRPGGVGRQAVEYREDGAPARRQDYGALESAGALNSTANDLSTLLAALLEGRRGPLGPALDCMLGTRRPGGQGPSNEAALGWSVYRDGEREIAWKDGFHHAFIGLDRAASLGVVVLTNQESPGGVNDLGLRLLDPSFPPAPEKGKAPPR